MPKDNFQNQKCLNADEINSLDTNDIHDLCSNSIFKDDEDSILYEYYSIEEANLELQKTPDGILLIHINAVSLCKTMIKSLIHLIS